MKFSHICLISSVVKNLIMMEILFVMFCSNGYTHWFVVKWTLTYHWLSISLSQTSVIILLVSDKAALKTATQFNTT